MTEQSAAAAPCRVSLGGAPGSFSDLAAHTLFAEEADYLHQPDFRLALQLVETGQAQACVLPLENAMAGPVPLTHVLLGETDVPLSAELVLPIHHQLLGGAGERLESVRRVVSHPMALAQCRRFLQAHGLEAIEGADTASSAASLAQRPEPGTAVVASLEAAERYGLHVLARNIEDHPDNATRFVVFGRPPPSRTLEALPRRGHKLMLALEARKNPLVGLSALFTRWNAAGVELTRFVSWPAGVAWRSTYFADLSHRDVAVLKRASEEATAVGPYRVLGLFEYA